MALPIASVHQRVGILQQDLDRLQTLQEERASEHKDVPGGATGLLVREVKQIGAGENAQTIELYKYDKAVVDSKLGLMEQAAKELGQRVEKKQLDVNKLSREQLIDLLNEEAEEDAEPES